jgi:hypothetical protein
VTKMQKRNSNVAGRAARGGVGRNNLDMPTANDEVTPPDAAMPAPAEADDVAPAGAPDSDAADGQKKAGRSSSGCKAPRKALARKKATSAVGEPKKKRGPPRPHRKLDQDVLSSRIEKLQKRIDKSKDILEEAERHIDAYNKETKYRVEDQDA